jgi:hypothetical protein
MDREHSPAEAVRRDKKCQLRRPAIFGTMAFFTAARSRPPYTFAPAAPTRFSRPAPRNPGPDSRILCRYDPRSRRAMLFKTYRFVLDAPHDRGGGVAAETLTMLCGPLSERSAVAQPNAASFGLDQAHWLPLYVDRPDLGW